MRKVVVNEHLKMDILFVGDDEISLQRLVENEHLSIFNHFIEQHFHTYLDLDDVNFININKSISLLIRIYIPLEIEILQKFTKGYKISIYDQRDF